MSKTKHNPPWKKKPKPNFIKFSKVQQAYLTEVINRQRDEFNEAIGSVYEEMGIKEKIFQAPPGTYQMRPDFSGLDVIPVAPPGGKKAKPGKPEPPGQTGKPKKEKTH